MLASLTDVATAVGATGLLEVFNTAGVLSPADVHTAEAVARMGGESDDRVRLALALAVRALRNGSVCIDLDTVSTTVFDESETGIDLAELPWPEPRAWWAACAASGLAADGADRPAGRPLRLAHGLLYLERYWLQEELVREQLQQRFAAPLPRLDRSRAAAGLQRLFPGDGLAEGELDRQRLAAAVSALGWVTVLAGGPGTGKTTTVARILALLHDQPGPPPRIALAAPTGKAAARLEEAVRAAAAGLGPQDRAHLDDVSASTLHRLLGWTRDQPEPVRPRCQQPPAARRGRGRRDVDGLADPDGPAAGGGPADGAAGAGRRPGPAVLGRGGGRAGRHRARARGGGRTPDAGPGRARSGCRGRASASPRRGTATTDLAVRRRHRRSRPSDPGGRSRRCP